MSTQIVYGAHTPARVWDALTAHATETRIHLDARCPICESVKSKKQIVMSTVKPARLPSLSSNTDSSARTQIHA